MRIQRVVENRDHLLLHRRAEIDQHVAATDEVHLRERRIGDDILPREDTDIPDGLADAVAAVRPREKAPQPLGRDVGLDALGIDRVARAVEHRLVHIRPEQLDRAFPSRLVHELHQRHRERENFLPARASRHPHAEGFLRGFALQDAREDFLLQRLEHLRIAEEAGDGNQDVLKERIEFTGALAQARDVAREAVHFQQHHAPVNAPAQRVRLVVGKINPRMNPEQREDMFKLAAVRRHGFRRIRRAHEQPARMTRDAEQFRRDPLRRKDEVRRAARARRHARVLRGFFRLRKSDPVRPLDRLEPQRAVVPRPGENDADRAFLLILRQRAEEKIHRRMRLRCRRPRQQLQDSIGDSHHLVRRDHIHMPPFHAHPVLRLRDAHLRDPRQQAHQRTRLAGSEMLHEHDRHPRIAGQGAEQLRHRLQPTR